ncbi:hypothetical protein HNY73_008897 [Argiope bruennichi]|uniref:Gustatory receptor n=1 Tax=Argiope bruennichi TaxID=94029 RepID=A0A8T0FA54_ARGBR|nr:hypothetical protein HNY73_008897 [Argiope bruennichi]
MISAYLISCSLPAVSYHVMRCRGKEIALLLQEFSHLSCSTYDRKGDMLLIIICCMPFLFSISVTATSIMTKDTEQFTYGYDVGSTPLKTFVLGLKFFLYFLLHPTLNNLFALLYCTICMRCRALIRDLKAEVMQYQLESFNVSKQFDILRQKEKLDSILDRTESIFSLSSFLIIITNILSCSSILGTTLLGADLQLHVVTQWLFYTIGVFGCLLTVFWVAGGISIELKEFKDAYYNKACARMLKSGIPEEPRMERWVLDKPDFVLTGYGIFSYTRNTLLAMVGALLTYTILVVNK